MFLLYFCYLCDMKAQMKIPYIADISEFGSEQLREVLLSKGAILPLASHNWASELWRAWLIRLRR